MKSTIKALYKSLPLKKEIFQVLKIFNLPRSVYQHLHFTGPFKVKIDSNHYFKMMHYGYSIENELFWSGLEGDFEAYSLKLWSKLCQKSNVIFDIGANTGTYSLIAKSINSSSMVYAFEPVKRAVDKLQKNIKLNNFDISVIAKAVSNTDGTAQIGDNIEDEHQYGATLNKKFIVGNTYEVETISLNSFIKQNNIQHIDLMKIDVEAFEPEVLEGFSDYLHKFKPTMLIEFVQHEPANRINEMLAGSGYLYFNINEVKGPRRVDKITKSDHFNFLICLPEVAKAFKLI